MLGKIEGGDRGSFDEWHHWLSGREFEETQGDSDGQKILVCCNPWGHKESNMT